ncbi:MAG: AtpZ/AtpI family protein [Nannocystales bacterium]
MKPAARREVSEKARRMQLARSRPRGVWASVGMIGAVGWMLALPTVAGAFGGHLLDMRSGGGVTYALAGLLLGLCAGVYAVWKFVIGARQ